MQAELAQIADLRMIVQNQQAQINELRNRVDFLTTLLNHSVTNIAANIAAPIPATVYGGVSTDGPTHGPSYTQVVQHPGIGQLTTGSAATADQLQHNQSNNATVASRSRPGQLDSVAAVYVEEHNRNRRTKNVVIAGLNSQNDKTDEEMVKVLFRVEFGMQPEVLSVRRLGRFNNSDSSTRVQPLLVMLAHVEDAAYLIANARKLRSSTNENVRTSVYLNADLTRAQAQAAFEIRRRRRNNREHDRGNNRIFHNSRFNNIDERSNEQQHNPAHVFSATTQSETFLPAVVTSDTEHRVAVGCDVGRPCFVPSTAGSSALTVTATVECAGTEFCMETTSYESSSESTPLAPAGSCSSGNC